MQYHLSDVKWGAGEIGESGGIVHWSFATTPGTGFRFTDYITDPIYRDMIRDAFQAWEDVADINFVEVTAGDQTDIHLGWDLIDGPFNVVGEAATRGSKTVSPLFSMTSAEIRFDISENWGSTREVGRNEVGLYQVALHEIGHAIGLDHTDDPDTIMFASDISRQTGLTPGDIRGVQIFYGEAQNNPQAPEPNPVVSNIATNGNDTFVARAGDDVINGRGGTDTLILSGNQSQYTLQLADGNLILTDRTSNGDGTDVLSSIEQLNFASGAPQVGNGSLNMEALDGITTLDPQALAGIVELYIAYFDRAPDAVGLAYWGNALAEGMSMKAIAASFNVQVETRAAYPETMSNAELATAVYDNVLGRVPDQEGFAYWVGQLDAGILERDTFILNVLGGAKVAPGPDASADHIANLARDKQYLADKTDIGTYFAVAKGMSDVDDAALVMMSFDGSPDSVTQAFAAVDRHYTDALDPDSGDFLMPLVGVLEDGFMV